MQCHFETELARWQASVLLAGVQAQLWSAASEGGSVLVEGWLGQAAVIDAELAAVLAHDPGIADMG